MLKVELTKETKNPFFGLRNCLELYQNASKGIVSHAALDKSWAEVQDSKENREMFFSLLFSIGDITGRQHNIFRKKVDSGGNAQREAFRIILEWLKLRNYQQFKKFMFAHLFNEYVSMDALLKNRVKTSNRRGKVQSVSNSLTGTSEYVNDLTDFIAGIIKGSNPAEKYFVAKFLTRPRISKRAGRKKLLTETREIMRNREKFLQIVSDKAGLSYVKKTTYIEFTGYYEWRKKYNGQFESVLFSSCKIKEFDQEEFKQWLNTLPAGARYRVRRRLLDGYNKPKEKWGKLADWFLDWEKYKDQKQTEVRVVEEKVRQGTATEDEKAELQTLKKEAKATVGAVNFQSMFTDIVLGQVDRVKVQPFLDIINLPYNNLIFVDDSGSMRHHTVHGFTAFDFGMFMATIFLTKNPDEEGRSMMGFFSAKARLYSTMTSRSKSPNVILRTAKNVVNEPLIDPNKHFLDNLQRMREFGQSVMTSNFTNISSIPMYLHSQLKDDITMQEQMQNFPVWTIISDSNWNNMSSPEGSINDFMAQCQNFFGFKPFIIAIDVSSYGVSADISRFTGIKNFMYIPPNPAQIEQLLTNFRDMDVMDVYTPLQSLHRSNRYELVRKATI